MDSSGGGSRGFRGRGPGTALRVCWPGGTVQHGANTLGARAARGSPRDVGVGGTWQAGQQGSGLAGEPGTCVGMVRSTGRSRGQKVRMLTSTSKRLARGLLRYRRKLRDIRLIGTRLFGPAQGVRARVPITERGHDLWEAAAWKSCADGCGRAARRLCRLLQLWAGLGDGLGLGQVIRPNKCKPAAPHLDRLILSDDLDLPVPPQDADNDGHRYDQDHNASRETDNHGRGEVIRVVVRCGIRGGCRQRLSGRRARDPWSDGWSRYAHAIA